MKRVSDNRLVICLPDELDDFVADFSANEMQSKAATIRQALGLLRAQRRREAATADDLFEDAA